MVYELKDTAKAAPLFEGWEDTMIWSCLQQVMGRICVTNEECPEAAFAYLGCFGFFAGTPERELVEQVPRSFTILTPQSQAWAELIEECFPNAEKGTRYAIKKGTRFDPGLLRKYVSELPEGYTLEEINGALYEKCLMKPETADFVAAFGSREAYLRDGRGFAVMKGGEIVSGASSYTRYREGIEIEVDTLLPERRKHLATAACAALILRCLEEGLYPSWDAQNLNSVHLAEKLGYEFDREYTVYEVFRNGRTH